MDNASNNHTVGKSEPPDAWERYSLVILLVILIVSLALRLYSLDSGLWLDEIITQVNYAGKPFTEILTSYDSENQHFLYSLLAHTSFLIFGESNWALRLPAVLFGIGSILALYLLGKQVTSTREALLSTALLAFSYHHVWFSQNARGYSGLLFWTLLSSWLLFRALEENRSLAWIIYALSAALGIYTHLTMVFVLVGQLCVYAYRWISHPRTQQGDWWKGLALGFAGAGLLTVLLHSPVIHQMMGTIGGSEASVVSSWKNPLWTLLEIIKGLQVSFSSFIFALGALVLFAAGLSSYGRTKPELVILLVIPPVVGAAVMIGIGHHLWPRFFFFSFGFGALFVIRGAMVAARGMGRMLRLKKGASEHMGTVLCVILVAVSAMSIPFTYGPKQDYLNAYHYIESKRMPGDQVVSVGLASYVYQNFVQNDWQSADSLEELENIREKSSRTWVVYTFEPVMESISPDMLDSILHNYDLQRTFYGTVGEGEIYIYLADANSTEAQSDQ